VAQEAAQSAKETAQERGQEHAEELRESATEKADEVGDTARPLEADAAQTRGAAPQVVVADPVAPQRRGT